MKLLKKTLSCILILAICLIVCPINSLYAAESINYQEDAYDAYLSLSDNLNIRMDTFSEKYPDNFGGCYLDNDTLVILLTDIDAETIGYYKALCNNSENIRFEQAEYSYKYLKELENNAIHDLESVTTVYESYVDVIQNECCIGVEDEVTLYSEVINSSDPIKIYQIETKPTATAMRGGESISNTKATCSICYFGKYNGKAALVTCGHTNSVGRSIKYGNTTIGSVVKQNLKTFTDVDGLVGSYGDFSIVDISGSSIAGSNYVKTSNGSISATGTANLIVGLAVKLYGSKSNLSGTVQSTSVSATFTDVEDYSQYKVKGLVTISGTTVQGGDSGGCVIYTTGAGVNRIAGCMFKNYK